jgi:hypothetical protein
MVKARCPLNSYLLPPEASDLSKKILHIFKAHGTRAPVFIHQDAFLSMITGFREGRNYLVGPAVKCTESSAHGAAPKPFAG